MPVEIRRVTDSHELEAIYRFRYDIYVTEMNRPQKYADHAGKRIVDPLDDSAACIIGAFEGDKVVGTVRTNFACDNALGDYFTIYGLASLSLSELDATSVTSRLMVDRSRRGSLLGIRLAVKMYDFNLDEGIRYDFIDCNLPRARMFLGLGYQFWSDISHEEYGHVKVMRLNVLDLDTLTQVKSPFLESLNACVLQRQSFSEFANTNTV